MRPRFYLPDLDAAAAAATLGADEAGHLTRVLRLGVGDEIDVFDGRGAMFRARVRTASRSIVEVELLGPAPAAREAAVRVTLVVSVLKADKMDDVVRDAVMMGVAAIVPVVTARSEVSLTTLTRGHRVDRWRRVAVASAKQSGRAVVPAIAVPAGFAAWRSAPEPRFVLVEPSAHAGRRISDVPPSERVSVLVGPEGGWAPEELEALLGAGAIPVALGPRTLRADAVPIAALAAVYEGWSGW